jgi:hypothetical protein
MTPFLCPFYRSKPTTCFAFLRDDYDGTSVITANPLDSGVDCS